MNNPFIFGGPVAPHDFYGRRHSVHFIMDRLYGRSRSSIALWGDRRVGKTSLLYYLAQPDLRRSWGQDADKHHIIFIDCQIFAAFSQPLFWQEVLDQATLLAPDSVLASQAETLLSSNPLTERALRRFFWQLQQTGETLTLLLDEFSHLIWTGAVDNRRQVQAFLAFLRTAITAVNPASPNPRPLALVASTRRPLDEVCRPVQRVSDAGSPFHNPFVFERLKPFQVEDIQTLIDARLPAAGVTFSPGEIQHLLAISGRHPILVQSYASELFTAKRSLGNQEITQFGQIDRQFYDRNMPHFHDFWLYSSRAEQILLGQVVRQAVDWQALSPEQESARRQLIDRGLLEETNRLFSPIFGDWLRLSLPRLEAQAQASEGEPSEVQLLWALDEFFSLDELRELCLALRVDYDNLPGDAKRSKARELIGHMKRHGRLAELVDLLAAQRPNLQLRDGVLVI